MMCNRESDRETEKECCAPDQKLPGGEIFPTYILRVDLHHQLRIRYYVQTCTPMSESESVSAGFQWMGSTLAGFQEAFGAVRKIERERMCAHE